MKPRADFHKLTTWIPEVSTVVVLFFLAAPLLVVVPVAFSSSSLLQFPPPGWSLRWFREFFESSTWISATITSVQAGVIVSILSTCFGLGLAITFDRFRFPGRTILKAIIIAPLVVPVIIIAVGLYCLYLKLGINGSFLGLVIGHTVITLPYSVVVIGAALAESDRRLENAAVGLGATWPRAFIEVTLPLISPSLIVSALFGYLISFDEVVIAIFVTGPSTVTLPRRLWDGIRFDLEPTIAAVATLLIAVSGLILLLNALLRRALRRASGVEAISNAE
jgi:putative spermidine/putrescine transport system permease protein